MRVCKTEQVRLLDRLTIEKYKIPGETLMERAGRFVAIVADMVLKEIEGRKTVVFVGKGNNGGDGFVAARYLQKLGYNVEIILLTEPEKIKGDALLNYEKIDTDKIILRKFDNSEIDADVIIDALLGTGISGAPRGDIAKAIDVINRSRENGAYVVSVDIPSGVNGDTGAADGVAVSADFTVTFGFAKVGQFLHPGRDLTGSLVIADIGLDNRAKSEVPIDYEFATIQEIAELLPERPPDGHKGTFGKGLIIAGSAGMTGAAVMSGLSFLRSGAGLCYSAVPRSLVDVVDTNAIEVVVLPMPEVRKKRCHTTRALGELHKHARDVDAVAIGPGLGTHFETREMVRRFLSKVQKTIVIDADGLNALAGEIDDTIPKITAPSVMTPHLGELSRLLEIPIEQIAKNKLENAKDWAKLLFTTLVIKGNPTIVADENEILHIIPIGNDGMATAGSGDVLTGLITGFLAQGLKPFDAARVGTYIHGLAGEIASQRLTRRAMIATDILDAIPDAMTTLENLPDEKIHIVDELNFKYRARNIGVGIKEFKLID